MILLDFNGIMYQCLHSSIALAKPRIVNEKYETSEFLPLMKRMIVSNLLQFQNSYSGKGNLTICVDDTKNGNWRNEIIRTYKSSRKSSRECSSIPFGIVFSEVEELLKNLGKTPWKIITVDRAEADDCILVLAEHFSKAEQVLIISADKDMIQAQRSPNVTQYSPVARKWVTVGTKGVDDIQTWITEHLVLGDVADEIPRICDFTEFTEQFAKYIKDNSLSISVENFSYDIPEVSKFISNGGEVWKKLRIGAKTVQKMIANGTINEFIAKYKDNYERNKILILSEGIPEQIKNSVISQYNNYTFTNNIDDFKMYLVKNDMDDLIEDLPISFNENLVSLDDFF